MQTRIGSVAGALGAAAFAFVLLAGGAAHAVQPHGTYGAVSYTTERSCSGVASNAICDGSEAPIAPMTPRVLKSDLEGGTFSTSSATLPTTSRFLPTPDGTTATGSVSFGAVDPAHVASYLPTITASVNSPLAANARIASNNLGFQAFHYTGPSASPLSFQATLHIDSAANTSPQGAYAGGATNTVYVAIWDPSIVTGTVDAADILSNVFYADCGTPGVLAKG